MSDKHIIRRGLAKLALDYETGQKTSNFITSNIGVVLNGVENIPKSGPAIIAANHESILDILLFARITHRYIHFIAKKELFEVDAIYGPWLAKTISNCFAMPIDRNNPSASQIKEYMSQLKQNHVLAVFPEGTRKRGLHEFHGLVGLLAYNKNIPIIPTGIIGSKDAQEHWFESPYVEVNFGGAMYCNSQSPKKRGIEKKKTIDNFTIKLNDRVAELMRYDKSA